MFDEGVLETVSTPRRVKARLGGDVWRHVDKTYFPVNIHFTWRFGRKTLKSLTSIAKFR